MLATWLWIPCTVLFTFYLYQSGTPWRMHTCSKERKTKNHFIFILLLLFPPTHVFRGRILVCLSVARYYLSI